MAEAFIQNTEYNKYLSAPDYISQFYGDKEGIAETKILSSPLVVTTLEYLFSNFIGLEYANFNNLMSTSNKAFAGCVSLKEINFPNLSYIESGTFENCNNLKSVYFPKCISAKNNIFNGCNSLEEINMPIYSRWNDYLYRFKISNLPKLNSISLPKIERNIILENLPRLADINLDSLSYVGAIDYGNSSSGGSHVYFKNLPSVEVLVLNGVKCLYQSAFMSIPNLKYLILPECESIKANIFTENISEYILPENVIFSLPKVSSINFSFNTIFKSINLPAVTDFTTFATGWRYNQPHYIGLPNVSIISSNAIFSYICESKSLSHDIIFDLPELQIIKQSAFEGDSYKQYQSPYGYILKTPKLSILESSAFHRYSYAATKDTKCLKEIYLNNVSILNEDVFLNTFNSSNSGIFFRNLNNIKEVKQGALANTKINGDTLHLPNCEKFDFRQGYYTSSYSRVYSLAIMQSDGRYISNLILPKLSEIIISPDDGYVSYYIFYNAMNLFPENTFSLETCKKIIFNDGSSIYANGYTSYMWSKKCTTLYIPECSILRYSYNEIINISYRSMLFNIRELYAPKLEILENVLFRDLHNITIPSMIHELNLEYTYGNVSYIDFSQSFSGCITLYNNYEYLQKHHGSYTLSYINLQNFSGYFEFDTDYYWSSYVSADRNGDFNIILGENIEKTYIDLGAMIQYYDENNLKNINTYIQKSVIDTNIYYNDLFYNSASAHANLYISNCNTISYTIFSSVLMLTSNSININVPYYTSYGTIFYVGGFISAPLLESINIYVSYNQLSFSTDIQDPASLSYYFPNIEITGNTHELYAPKLSKLNIIFPNEVRQYISMYRPIIDFGYDRPNGLTSITLGISEMSDLFNGTFSDGVFSAYNRWEYLNDRYITYLSFSRLNGIPGYHFQGPNWSDWTFYLTNAIQVNFDNISYISYHGLYIGKIESISFPNLLYMEDTAFNASNLKFISFPKLQSLGAGTLYSCSNMRILSLPSTCSKFSTNAIPSNFEVLDLYYNGVVSGSLIGGNYWNSTYRSSAHIIRVPSTYLSAYKNDAFWGSYLLNFRFNIVAI